MKGEPMVWSIAAGWTAATAGITPRNSPRSAMPLSVVPWFDGDRATSLRTLL
jgi:hypothetical protein